MARAPFEPLLADTRKVMNTDPRQNATGDPLAAADAIEQAIVEAGAENVCMVILEPVQNAGGCLVPPPGYARRVREICDRHGVLLCCDEVICAFGRLGHWFGSERLGFEPDMITFAKGVTSGYMPLGGVLVGERVRAPFWDDPVPGAVFRHGYTYSGHSGAAAAAFANLDIIDREDLIARVRALEPKLDASVRRLAAVPTVGEIRTVGLTAAVALAPAVLERDPTAPDKVVAAALQHGVATRVLRAHAIHISPPFVITEDQIDAMVDGIGNAIEDALGVPA
jgi:adenosylmethionine-8-amino-7-oxononanoate aminotransferase